jgi:sulfate transporter 4
LVVRFLVDERREEVAAGGAAICSCTIRRTMHVSESVASALAERGRSGASRPPVKLLPVNHHHVHPTPSQQEYASSDSSSRWGRRDWLHLIEQLVPAVRWLRTYDVDNYLKADLIAGITVGTMLVPQAMSYARLAGLHPIYGLYSGFVPVFAYAIFGSSRQLAIGPVALVSLLISNGLTPLVDLAEEGADVKYTQLCILLALMVGVMESLMGILRLGWLVHFISHSIISGFTSASAIIIAFSQAKSFLGYSITRSSKIIPLIESIYAGRSQVMMLSFTLPSILIGTLRSGVADYTILLSHFMT